MALRVSYQKKSHGVTWKSGSMYEFNYSNYENDSRPLGLVLNIISGFHPRTNHEHHYFQMLNLNYIPRKDRKRFIKIWKKEMEKGKSLKMTWDRVTSQFPYLKVSIRRYFTKPKYMVRNIKKIPPDQWEAEVIRSLPKDFSKAIKRKVGAKMKQFFAGKRKK